MPGFADFQAGRTQRKKKPGDSLDDKNRAVMGDDDDMEDAGGDDDPDGDSDDEDDDNANGDDEPNPDDLNDNADGELSDNGADDNADGGEDDADDAQQPNPKLVARRGAGAPQRKRMEKALPTTPAEDEPIAIFDAEKFFENLTKSMDHNNQKFLVEFLPEAVREVVAEILTPEIVALKQQNVKLSKALQQGFTVLDQFTDYYSERTDDLEEKNEELKKSLAQALEDFNLVKSALNIGDKIEKGADGKPVVTPLSKANDTQAAAGGTILSPSGESGETKKAKILRLVKAGELLQEKLHKTPDGLTDMVVTVSNLEAGQSVPDSLVERLEKSVGLGQVELDKMSA